MPDAKFEMCRCGRHGMFTRPSGIVVKIRKKVEARQQLDDIWRLKQINAVEYTSVRNLIEIASLPDGSTGMRHDDPIIEIMNASEAQMYGSEPVFPDTDIEEGRPQRLHS